MTDILGELIAGRYRRVQLIGRGAVADVWHAIDEQTGQDVALKLVHQRLASHDDSRIRFRREVETLRRFEHPNVVKLIEAGLLKGGLPYLTLELLRGRSMLHELAEHKRLPIGRAVAIALDILAGLEAAHAIGVIHRDLKPANIMLVSDGERSRAVLIDFGLVALQGAPSITSQGSVVGTPSYIAPERLRGDDFDERSDLYGVGVLLYEMVSGVRPYVGATIEATIIAALTTHCPYPSEVAPEAEIPRAIDDLIVRAIEKRPEDRAASARAMSDELRSAFAASK